MVTPARQLQLHDPDNGVFGTCWPTCLAMVLDLNPAAVPPFCDEDDWFEATLRWLRLRGVTLIEVPESEMYMPTPGAVVIVNGASPRGPQRHSIVRVYTSGVEWIDYDPHPSDAGLLSVDSYSLLVPFQRHTT